VREFSSKATAEDTNPLDGFAFKLDNQEFKCLGHLSVLDLSDLARRVGALDPEADPATLDPDAMAAAVGSMSESMLMAMGSAEYERLRKHVRTQQTPDRVVIEIMQMINERIQSESEKETGLPTEPSSRSSAGPAETDERTSRVISFQSGDVRVLPPPEDHKQPKAKGPARATVRRQSGQRAAG
jgi:hypothetical protein